MPVYNIQHITQYDYDAPVIDSINLIKIFPFQSADQQVIHHELIISLDPSVMIHSDYWGNRTGVFTVTEPHQKMTIESRLTIQTETIHTANTDPLPVLLQFDYTQADHIESSDAIKEILGQVPGEEPGSGEQGTSGKIQGTMNKEQGISGNQGNLQEGREWMIADFCNQYIFKNFTYQKGITTIETTVDEILKHKKGVCQDFAHLLLQLLRTAKIACRYVSGYICPNKNGMRGEGATHAWVEVWIEGRGWLGLDPTNNMWVGNSHIKLAVGRDFNDCSPVKGTFKGLANQKLSVFVSIGYEDGNVFEDRTLVTLQTERPLVPAIIPRHFYSQQQQQQQQ